ncbi:MAG: peptide deformylase [Lachnospiraceae bacterium]|nr:peptide deformylase [Lachnospiraceae bacterium]
MAIRNIREIGDEILGKISKEVMIMTPRTKLLISDMIDTMYSIEGIGLSACQVGVLKRIFVVDANEEYGEEPLVLINPRILESSGEQTGNEGCLSIPGKHGTVTRPNYVKVLAYDEKLKPFEFEATELLARAVCHEIDHLDGRLYLDLIEGELRDNSEADEEENEE